MLRPAVLLRMCAAHAFRRASTHGFRRKLPASYGGAWPLLRLNFHQLVMPGLARRTRRLISSYFRRVGSGGANKVHRIVLRCRENAL